MINGVEDQRTPYIESQLVNLCFYMEPCPEQLSYICHYMYTPGNTSVNLKPIHNQGLIKPPALIQHVSAHTCMHCTSIIFRLLYAHRVTPTK